jgi:hypothetical protein
MNDRTAQVDDSSTEVNIRPLQAQSLRYPQAGSSGQEDQRSGRILKFDQKLLQFFGIQNVRCPLPLRTLPHEADRIPLQQFVTASMSKDDMHGISDLSLCCVRQRKSMQPTFNFDRSEEWLKNPCASKNRRSWPVPQ